MRKNRGQALVLLLVFLPLLILIFRVVARSGATALYHDKIENHCDRKILDALAIEAGGLEKIGRLNPYSRKIIKMRRFIDPLVTVAPQLIPLQLALKGAQKTLSLIQKTIKLKTALSFSETLAHPPPKKFEGRIHETYTPLPLVNFYLKDEEGYEGEVGSPLKPTEGFASKSEAQGTIKIFTEKFLSWWPEKFSSPNMTLECRAQIQIETLEDPWTVQLVKPMAKPLLN